MSVGMSTSYTCITCNWRKWVKVKAIFDFVAVGALVFHKHNLLIFAMYFTQGTVNEKKKLLHLLSTKHLL